MSKQFDLPIRKIVKRKLKSMVPYDSQSLLLSFVFFFLYHISFLMSPYQQCNHLNEKNMILIPLLVFMSHVPLVRPKA